MPFRLAWTCPFRYIKKYGQLLTCSFCELFLCPYCCWRKTIGKDIHLIEFIRQGNLHELQKIIDKCIIFTTKHSTSLGFLTEPHPKKGPWSLCIIYCLFAIKRSFLHIYIIYIIYLYILYIYTFINLHKLYIKKWLNVEQFFI